MQSKEIYPINNNNTMIPRLDLGELSSLRFELRKDSTSLQTKRTAVLLKQREFVRASTINNFAMKITNEEGFSSINAAEKSRGAAKNELKRAQEKCTRAETEIKKTCTLLLEELKEHEIKTQQFEKLTENLPQVLVDTPKRKAIENEAERLRQTIDELEQSAEDLELEIAKENKALQTVLEKTTSLSNDIQTRREEALMLAKTAANKPKREQLQVMHAFLGKKLGVHEKLSGLSQIASTPVPNEMKISVGKDCVVTLKFDDKAKLVYAQASDAFTKLEKDLETIAVEDNDVKGFLRKTLLRVRSANFLRNEIEELQSEAMRAAEAGAAGLGLMGRKKTSPEFALEYNAVSRTVMALFHKGQFEAKLRVPCDYLLSPVELLHLEDVVSFRNKENTARKVRERLASVGLGKKIRDWIHELNKTLLEE